MSDYVSAEALVGDALLRIDALGDQTGCLIVEGPDDKRLFGRWVR